MRQYQTKTGVTLQVIQGEGLGSGIPEGELELVTENWAPKRKSFIEIVSTPDYFLFRVGPFFYESYTVETETKQLKRG